MTIVTKNTQGQMCGSTKRSDNAVVSNTISNIQNVMEWGKTSRSTQKRERERERERWLKTRLVDTTLCRHRRNPLYDLLPTVITFFYTEILSPLSIFSLKKEWSIHLIGFNPPTVHFSFWQQTKKFIQVFYGTLFLKYLFSLLFLLPFPTTMTSKMKCWWWETK